MRLRVLFKAIFESKMREKVSDSNSKRVAIYIYIQEFSKKARHILYGMFQNR